MVAPGLDINLIDLTVYAPQISTAILGCVGPATKGPVNRLNVFTDEGNFVNFHGRPVDRTYAQRGCIRYFRAGNQLTFVRVAGPNLATATLMLLDAAGNPILKLDAASPGTWANADIRVAVTHNGTQSYNILVYFRDQLVESHISLDNGIVVTTINNDSSRIVAELQPGAGATFPASTVDPNTGEVLRLSFTGGDDGAFAKSESASSSTSGLTGKRFYGKMDSSAGSRVFRDIVSIGAALAGLSVARGTVGTAVVPGSFTLRLQTGASSWVELSDNEDLAYGPGGAGLGILTDGTATAIGFVDYRTGSWGADVSALAGPPTLFSGGTISAIWIRAATESVGATAKGQGAYAGTLSRGGVAPGFYNSNKVVITVPVSHTLGLVGTGISNPDSADALLQTMAGWIVPGTIKLTPTHDTETVPDPIWDDGFGGWRTGPNGTGVPVAGTVDYRTGQWAITAWPLPVFPSLTSGNITAEYDIQILDMGGGAVAGETGTFIGDEVLQPSDAGGDANAADTDAGAQRIAGPLLPGNVKLVISDVGGNPETFWDDGVGGWLTRPRGDPRAVAAAGGAVDYTTGAWSITASGTIAATATIVVDYTSVPADQARRALRGTGPLFQADVTANAAGMDLTDPAAANDFDGKNFLDHTTGEFGFELLLVETGDRTFDVLDNGTMSAVYAAADILGFGDGSTTVFTGTLEPAPFRREADRLQAFQGAQASAGGAGDPQVAFAALGTAPTADFWNQNVVASSDPDNTLDFRDGSTSIQWTSAPLLDESVYVIAEETVMHVVARYPGDIGNERAVISEGIRVSVDEDPSLAGTLRARVLFATGTEESFGQATTIDELVTKINDPLNGSDLIRAELTDFSGELTPDVFGALGAVGPTQVIGMAGAFTVSDIVGTKVGQTTTGLQMFRNDEVVPMNWVMVPGQWHRQVIQGLQELCELKHRRCIGIIPAPDADDPFDHRDYFNGAWKATTPGGPAQAEVTVPFPPLVEINSRNLATIVPWVQYLDQYTNQEVFEPADGDMAKLIAGTPAPWFPIAGLRRGRVTATALRYSASREDRAFLQGFVGTRQEIVNPIIRKQGRGLVLYGQQTAQRTPSSTDRINVMWTVNVIMNILDAASQEFPFEINDAILWREVTGVLNDTLKPIIARRGLQDAFVVVDATTTTPEDVDALRLNAKLFIKPQQAAEFITYDLILTPTGADFADVIAAG